MRVAAIVSVHVLVEMIYPLVGPPSELAQGLRLMLPLGCAPLEVVSIGGLSGLI